MAGHQDGGTPARQQVAASDDAAIAGGNLNVEPDLSARVHGGDASGRSFDEVAGLQVGSGNFQINYFGPADEGSSAAGLERRLPVRLAPAPAYLAGRDSLLQDLHERLGRERSSGPRVVALCGLGGVGKTAAALSYAHEHLSRYVLAWQIPAGDPVSLSAGYAELAAYIGIERHAAGAGSAVQDVHNVLAARAGRWLLIFDDAAGPESLRDYLPPAGDGEIIVTSQDASWPSAQQVQVDLLDPADATAFLMERTGDRDGRAAAEVARMLGRLPLALEQAGAYTVATGCGLGGYAELLAEYQGDLLVRGQPSGYRKTVATTWLAAFSELEKSAPQSITLLRLLAFFQPEPIPLNALRPGNNRTIESVSAAVAAPVRELLTGKLPLNDAVAALGRYSLISIPLQGTVSVHQLVQAITRSQIPEDQLTEWLDAASSLLRSALPEDPALPENWPAFRMLTPHVLATLPAADMRSTVQFLRYSGSYGAAAVVQEAVAQDALDRVGINDSESLTEMANLFYIQGETGDADGARDGLAGLVNGLKNALDPETPFYLQLQAGLARWTGTAGDPVSAITLYEDLLPRLERVFGVTSQRTQQARYNYAAMLGEAEDWASARDLYLSMLPIYENNLGVNHPDTFGVRANLAYATGGAGEPGRSRELYAALVAEMELSLGRFHQDTITARINMAYMTAAAGDLPAALDQLSGLLATLEQYGGPDDVHVKGVKELMRRLREADL